MANLSQTSTQKIILWPYEEFEWWYYSFYATCKVEMDANLVISVFFLPLQLVGNKGRIRRIITLADNLSAATCNFCSKSVTWLCRRETSFFLLSSSSWELFRAASSSNFWDSASFCLEFQGEKKEIIQEKHSVVWNILKE